MSSLLNKRFFLPCLAAIAAFVLFRLALHNPIDARTFASLEIPSITPPNEFAGIYTQLLARILNSIFYDAELSFRILTALATGFSVYFIQKLFPENVRWSIGYVIANISFLYFAMHSPSAMMIVLIFSAYLASWEDDGHISLSKAGLLASLMLGFDSLLAVALILYASIRIIGSDIRPRAKLSALTATLPGIAGWILLEYLLYASKGFSLAIGGGFDHLFERVNPINFGIGLIVTFNLLLIWVFRTPSDKVRPRYLGSLLIVLFLFVRVEPLHVVLLLITGVSYLHKLSALPKQKWVKPTYALLNIGAFFLLPSVSPLEAAYNVRVSRPSEAELYYTSYFAKHLPSYQSLIEKGAMRESVVDLAARSSGKTPFILDPSLENAFAPVSLRALSLERPVGGFDPARRRFRSTFGGDTLMSQLASGAPRLYYFSTSAGPRVMDTLFQAPLQMESGVRLYTIDSSRFNEFFDAYIYYHYLSFH